MFPHRVGRVKGIYLYANPLVSLVLLQSMTRMDRRPFRATFSLGVSSPTAHEASGSDLYQAYLTWLRSVFRHSQPLDALLLPKPFRFYFTPVTLLGFALQRFPLRTRRNHLSVFLPLLTFLVPVRFPYGSFPVIEGTFRGVSWFEVRSSGRKPLGLPTGAVPLLGFHLFRVFSLPAMARPLSCLLSCTSVAGRRAIR